MHPLTPRERLLAPFRGLVPDQPAWLPDLSYWHQAMSTAGRVPTRFAGHDGYVRLHEHLGATCYYGCGGATFHGRYDGVETGLHEAEGVRDRWWRTPVGEVRDRWRYIPESYCWAHTDYAVQSPADLAVVLDLYRRLRYEPHPGHWAQVSDRLGDAGLPISPAPRSPLPALLTDWCGVVTTCYLLVDEPALVGDVLAAIDAANDPAWEAMAASEVELFHVCDNLDSRTSTSRFEPHLGPYYRRRLAQLHAAGKQAVTHLDGGVRGLLGKLVEAGFDGIESITPEPVGDVSVAEVRALAGNDRVVLWGGVPGAMFARPFNLDDLQRQTVAWLEATGRDGRAVVGSADQVPPDGTIEGCRAVAEAIARWAGR